MSLFFQQSASKMPYQSEGLASLGLGAKTKPPLHLTGVTAHKSIGGFAPWINPSSWIEYSEMTPSQAVARLNASIFGNLYRTRTDAVTLSWYGRNTLNYTAMTRIDAVGNNITITNQPTGYYYSYDDSLYHWTATDGGAVFDNMYLADPLNGPYPGGFNHRTALSDTGFSGEAISGALTQSFTSTLSEPFTPADMFSGVLDWWLGYNAGLNNAHLYYEDREFDNPVISGLDSFVFSGAQLILDSPYGYYFLDGLWQFGVNPTVDASVGWSLIQSLPHVCVLELIRGLTWHTEEAPQAYFVAKYEWSGVYPPNAVGLGVKWGYRCTIIKTGLVAPNQKIGYGGDIPLEFPDMPDGGLSTLPSGYPITSIRLLVVIGESVTHWAARVGVTVS